MIKMENTQKKGLWQSLKNRFKNFLEEADAEYIGVTKDGHVEILKQDQVDSWKKESNGFVSPVNFNEEKDQLNPEQRDKLLEYIKDTLEGELKSGNIEVHPKNGLTPKTPHDEMQLSVNREYDIEIHIPETETEFFQSLKDGFKKSGRVLEEISDEYFGITKDDQVVGLSQIQVGAWAKDSNDFEHVSLVYPNDLEKITEEQGWIGRDRIVDYANKLLGNDQGNNNKVEISPQYKEVVYRELQLELAINPKSYFSPSSWLEEATKFKGALESESGDWDFYVHPYELLAVEKELVEQDVKQILKGDFKTPISEKQIEAAHQIVLEDLILEIKNGVFEIPAHPKTGMTAKDYHEKKQRTVSNELTVDVKGMGMDR